MEIFSEAGKMEKELQIVDPKSLENSVDNMTITRELRDDGKYSVYLRYSDSDEILKQSEFDDEESSRLKYYEVLQVAADIAKLVENQEIEQAKKKTAELFSKFVEPIESTEIIRHEMLIDDPKFKVIKTADKKHVVIDDDVLDKEITSLNDKIEIDKDKIVSEIPDWSMETNNGYTLDYSTKISSLVVYDGRRIAGVYKNVHSSLLPLIVDIFQNKYAIEVLEKKNLNKIAEEETNEIIEKDEVAEEPKVTAEAVILSSLMANRTRTQEELAADLEEAGYPGGSGVANIRLQEMQSKGLVDIQMMGPKMKVVTITPAGRNKMRDIETNISKAAGTYHTPVEERGYFLLIKDVKPEDINKVMAELEQLPHIAVTKEAFSNEKDEDGENVYIDDAGVASNPSAVDFYNVSMVIYDKDVPAFENKKDIAGYKAELIEAKTKTAAEPAWKVKKIKTAPKGYGDTAPQAPYADARVVEGVQKIEGLMNSIDAANKEIQAIQKETASKTTPIEEAKAKTSKELTDTLALVAEQLDVGKEKLVKIKNNLGLLATVSEDRKDAKLTKDWILEKLNEKFPDASKYMETVINGLQAQQDLIKEKVMTLFEMKTEQEFDMFKYAKIAGILDGIINWFKGLANKLTSALGWTENLDEQLENKVQELGLK